MRKCNQRPILLSTPINKTKVSFKIDLKTHMEENPSKSYYRLRHSISPERKASACKNWLILTTTFAIHSNCHFNSIPF